LRTQVDLPGATGTWQYVIGWLDGSGAAVSSPVEIGSGTTDNLFTRIGVFVDVPSAARSAWVEGYLLNGATTGAGSIGIIEPMVCGAGPNQTVFPAFSPGPGNALTDFATAYKVEALSPQTFPYDSGGTATYTSQNVAASLKDQAGIPIASGVTWKYVVISGTVNGNAAGTTEYSMTVGTSNAYFAVTSLGSNSNKVEIRAYIGTIMWPLQIELQKQFAPATSGGGGGGGTLPVTAGVAGTSINTTPVVVASLTGTTGSSQTAVTLAVTADVDSNSLAQYAATDIAVKFQRLIGATWTDIGSVQNATGEISDYDHYSGSVAYSFSDTGLSGSTTYQWRIVAYKTGGISTGRISGTSSAT